MLPGVSGNTHMKMSSISIACDGSRRHRLQRLFRLHQAGSFFMMRSKRNMDAQRRHSHPTDRSTGAIFDRRLALRGYQSAKDCPETFRGIRYKFPRLASARCSSATTRRSPALSICSLCKARWLLELFIRWLKMHLRAMGFFGTSEDAIKSQIWIAVSVYVLVAIIKKRYNLSRGLCESQQILSVNPLEKTPPDIALSRIRVTAEADQDRNQLILPLKKR
jgi:hypothetical protein